MSELWKPWCNYVLCDYDGWESSARTATVYQMPCVKFSLVGDSQWKAVQESLPPEWAKCVCVSGFWTSGVNQLPGGPRLGHHKSHLPSHFLCAGASNKNQSRSWVKKNYTRTAQPARLPGKLAIAPSFDVHLFCSLHYWGVSTWLCENETSPAGLKLPIFQNGPGGVLGS